MKTSSDLQMLISEIQEDLKHDYGKAIHDDWGRGYVSAMRLMKLKLEHILKERLNENQDH
jgi:hypothetical protein